MQEIESNVAVATSSEISGEAFIWSRVFETGLPDVDKQHQVLVKLINQLGQNIDSDSPDRIYETLQVLTAYTAYHFQTEEAIMKAEHVASAHADSHREAHRQFVRQVEEWGARHKSAETISLHEMLNFLVNWLTYHVLGADQSLGRQIKEIRAGVSPKAAFEQDRPSNDPRADILLGALGNLYGDLFARANELRASEEKYREMFNRAEHLNAMLQSEVEQKVAELREKDLLLIQQARNAAMGEMVSNIAHQWRQPLTSLGLILQNITLDFKEDLISTAVLEAYVADGMNTIQLMSDTIDDFRNFFLHNKRKLSFQPNDLVNQAVKLVSPSFSHDSIEVNLYTCDESCTVSGYPSEFSQVLLNALTNAKDAIVSKGRGGKVDIHVRKAADMNTISICNNGGRIPEEILPMVFDPYFTTKEKGTGIGLYMSKMIVDKMGGDIVIRNIEDGVETLITLPLVDTQAVNNHH